MCIDVMLAVTSRLIYAWHHRHTRYNCKVQACPSSSCHTCPWEQLLHVYTKHTPSALPHLHLALQLKGCAAVPHLKHVGHFARCAGRAPRTLCGVWDQLAAAACMQLTGTYLLITLSACLPPLCTLS